MTYYDLEGVTVSVTDGSPDVILKLSSTTISSSEGSPVVSTFLLSNILRELVVSYDTDTFLGPMLSLEKDDSVILQKDDSSSLLVLAEEEGTFYFTQGTLSDERYLISSELVIFPLEIFSKDPNLFFRSYGESFIFNGYMLSQLSETDTVRFTE